LQENRYAAPTV